MRINAGGLHYKVLNKMIKESPDDTITVDNCFGQRYIGSGLCKKELIVNGTPGNGLGAYLDGSVIRIAGNAQDAAGDTMNDGTIYIHGSSGDACGYAMRGGRIFIRGNAGYRAGVHMKQYNEKKPVLVVGGRAGSFLGEYLAGGIIIVLGLGGYNRVRQPHCEFVRPFRALRGSQVCVVVASKPLTAYPHPRGDGRILQNGAPLPRPVMQPVPDICPRPARGP